MKQIFTFCCLSLMLASCTNKPSTDLAQTSLKQNFENNIEVVDFSYINGIKSEDKKIEYYSMYFDATIKFINNWVDNSPGFKGKSYQSGDMYKIEYAKIDFVFTDNGWIARTINFKSPNGFQKFRESISKDIIQKKIQPTTLEATNIPAEIQYQGIYLDGKKWKDNNGINYLIISEKKIGNFGASGFQGLIYGCCYFVNGSEVKKMWEIQDAGQNEVTQVDYVAGSLKVADIDNDGIFENSFCYIENGEHPNDSPYPLKSLLHSGKMKYQITGTFCPNKQICGKNEMHLGNEFLNAPTLYKTFATSQWHEMIASLTGENVD